MALTGQPLGVPCFPPVGASAPETSGPLPTIQREGAGPQLSSILTRASGRRAVPNAHLQTGSKEDMRLSG